MVTDTGIMKNRNGYLKYIAIALAVIFLISSGLLLLELWEKKRGQFPEGDGRNGEVTYKGTDYVRKDGVESFLILGLDKADEDDPGSGGVRADFLMLFVFDNDKKQFTALQINRDTMTKVNSLAIGGMTVVDSQTAQIALAYNYVIDDNDKIRCRNTKDSAEELLHGTHIDHYLSLTMDTVPALNDLVGGVEIEVRDDMTSVDPALVKGQKVTLTGEQALKYVRSRYGLDDSSNLARMERQRQYLGALYDKAVAMMKADTGFVLTLSDTLSEHLVYDSSDEKLQKLVDKFENYEFLGIREIAGEAREGEEYIEFYPDEDALWQTVIELFYKPKKK